MATKKWHCDYCEECFNSQSEAETHEETHFLCKHCSKGNIVKGYREHCLCDYLDGDELVATCAHYNPKLSGEDICLLRHYFPGSFINNNFEFIAHKDSNAFISLDTCDNLFDLKCRVIEYFSRHAFKTQPYDSIKKNKEFNEFMASGVNGFLGTNFNDTDFEIIYTYLGNGINKDLTQQFVSSNYDMNILYELNKK